MLRYLVDFATPLHTTIHMILLEWIEVEDKSHQALKVILYEAPVVQPPDWTKDFHVLLMQQMSQSEVI